MNLLLMETFSHIGDSQPEITLSPRGYVAVSGDIFSCYDLGGGGDATDIKWVEVQDAATVMILQCTGQTPENRVIGPNVSNAKQFLPYS